MIELPFQVAELLEKYMKRLSDYIEGGNVSGHMSEQVARVAGLDEDLDSPLYASPTAYGYSKIGEHRHRSSGSNRVAEQQVLAGKLNSVLKCFF